MKKPLQFLLVLCLIASNIAATDLEAERARISAAFEALETNTEGLTESERFERYDELSEERSLLEFPEMATFRGLEGDHGRWSDRSKEANARGDAHALRMLKLVEGFDRDQLEDSDKLNYDLLLDRLRSGVEGQRFKGDYLQISQMGGPHSNITRTLSMMPAFRLSQYEDILSRMAGAPEVMRTTIGWLKEGLEEGVTPPRITMRDVPDQVRALIVDDAMESPMLKAFAKFPDSVSEEDRTRLVAEATRIYSDEIKPVLEELHSFLVDEYVPGCRDSIAASTLPDGDDWYAYNVKQRTTTNLTPGEIHEIGLSEVARIRELMDGIIEEVGFEGSFSDFTEFLRTDPQFYFTEAEDLLAAYRDISKRADLKLVEQFGHLPRLPYGVVPIPDYMAKSQTTAYYMPGSLKAGRAGKYYANTYALDTRPKWEMEALTLHEAMPGHHLQIAIAQELEDLPRFRKFGGYTAFSEGWGLYAESLGEDMGFYQDPYSKFGQLTYEMWRAVRLVVDTGMHSMDWTRQEAIDFFVNNSAKSEHDIVVEIDRYIVWPGQALAYKIGELKIKELRAYATEQLGDAFDVRAFHDKVLGNGALPLSVLDQHIRDWVETQRGPEVATPETKGP